MESFKINNKIEFVCNTKNTRNGFKHEAVLLINGSEVDEIKIWNLNRTWEKYEYESVLKKLIDKDTLNAEDKKEALNFISGDLTNNNDLKFISRLARIGEVLSSNQEDKNNFQKRILKAGLSNKGLSFPENWENLTESEKSKRLNKATEFMGGFK